MYKLILSIWRSDDLSVVFYRNRNIRQRELTKNKNVKGKNHIRLFLKDVIGFVEHYEKISYGWGYKLTITRNSDNSVLKKNNAVNNAKI